MQNHVLQMPDDEINAVFTHRLELCQQAIVEKMAQHLSGEAEDLQLLEQAMRYGALGGGKRLRAFLLLISAQFAGADETNALHSGVALELVHAYSLIHDDLPAMDDDDLRHGKPCVHLAFDEATAILAGDSLLTYAFELLSQPVCHCDAKIRIKLVQILAKAAGSSGMVGGQHLDMLGAAHQASSQDHIARIQRLQSLKTGALFVAATQMGVHLGKISSELLTTLQGYAEKIGLAFQIYDDWLDIAGDAQILGKATGKDDNLEKLSFLQIMSHDKALDYTQKLIDDAIVQIMPWQKLHPQATASLIGLARFVIAREQ